MIRKTLVSITFLSSVFISFPSFSATDPCSSLADLQSKSSKDSFVGYGSSGNTQKEADENARVDLAHSIRQKIEATSVVTETTTTTTLNSTSKSIVSELLSGAKTLRRCKLDGGGFSTVITLEKSFFVSSLEKKLAGTLNRAKTLVQNIEHPKINTEEGVGQFIDSAKIFLSTYKDNFSSDLELCQTYDGCKNMNEDSMHELAELIAHKGDQTQYLLITNDALTKDLRSELIELLENEKIKIADSLVKDSVSNEKRKILANCKLLKGSKIPGTDSRVVTTTCFTEGYIGKQKMFRYVYSCKSMADNNTEDQESVNVCRSRLKKE